MSSTARGRTLFGTMKNKVSLDTLHRIVQENSDVETSPAKTVGIAPTHIHIPLIANRAGKLHLAAQNVGWNASYSLTGECNPCDLLHFGVGFCIVGHSERRRHLNEDEVIIKHRLQSCIRYGIKPILCIGETLDQFEERKTRDVLTEQLSTLIVACNEQKVDLSSSSVIAYEPMWAISTSGSGRTLDHVGANEIHASVRHLIANLVGPEQAASTQIIYGGSLSDKNCASFFSEEDIDGGLVGTGMQAPDRFRRVVESFMEHC